MRTRANTKWAEGLVRFVNASPSPYHALDAIRSRLLAEGFKELSERTGWPNLEGGGMYFTTRQGSALMAFIIPPTVSADSVAVVAEAAHIDSPCLRVRPVSSSGRPSDGGLMQVAVETYGGGLWHTWFDRDLAVAGRVIVARNGNDNAPRELLVRTDNPVMRVPTLAIHLDRSVNESFKFSTETHLQPILGTSTHVKSELDRSGRHNMDLFKALGISCDQDMQILDSDLCLYDAQPACIGGLKQEFVFGGRLDNLCMSFCILEGLLMKDDVKHQDGGRTIRAAVWYDHEEVGSESSVGAEGAFLQAVTAKILSSWNIPDHAAVWARSLIVSADMAHAVHPNYPEKHHPLLRPAMHQGVVLKYNAQQRYATSSRSAAIIRWIAGNSDDIIPLQEFEVKNDSPCGSTIGPMLAAGTGALTVDLGVPQLSMHSIREMASVIDVQHGVELMAAVYRDYNPDLLI